MFRIGPAAVGPGCRELSDPGVSVASVPIPTVNPADLGVDTVVVSEHAARVQRADYFVPPTGKGAEMLEGATDEIVDRLIEMVRAKGGKQ